MKLTIDNQEVEIDAPMTIYHAAKEAGIDIPVMCYKEGYDYFTSCMMCVVKDTKTGKTLPACSAQAAEGMVIETQSEEIREARKFTLELLLSEHVGDCEAPCQRLCAVHSEIPKMIREIKEEQFEEAIATVRADMAIPSILERFCNAPCEKGCRRAQYDEGQRMVLAELMWRVIGADGRLSEHETQLARKLAHLLDLKPGYLSEARRRAEDGDASRGGA